MWLLPLTARARFHSGSKKKREGTARVKSRAGGQTGVEARLETKAHRRVSRRSVRQRLADLVKDVDDADAVF